METAFEEGEGGELDAGGWGSVKQEGPNNFLLALFKYPALRQIFSLHTCYM